MRSTRPTAPSARTRRARRAACASTRRWPSARWNWPAGCRNSSHRYPELQVDLVCNERIVDLIDDGFDVAPQLPSDLLRHNCLTYSQLDKPRDWRFTGPDGAPHK
jgi:DNA-binding transcriptional LysR family regulator